MWGPIDLAARVLRALPDARQLRPDAHHTAADLFERSVSRHGERPCILHGESGEPRVVTYTELDEAANRVAWWALDRGLRERILPYLERIRDELAIPMLYVSHAESEVRAIADWVVALDEGRVVRSGAELSANPPSTS